MLSPSGVVFYFESPFVKASTMRWMLFLSSLLNVSFSLLAYAEISRITFALMA